MYIQNRCDGRKFNACSPLQYFKGLISLKPATAYKVRVSTDPWWDIVVYASEAMNENLSLNINDQT